MISSRIEKRIDFQLGLTIFPKISILGTGNFSVIRKRSLGSRNFPGNLKNPGNSQFSIFSGNSREFSGISPNFYLRKFCPRRKMRYRRFGPKPDNQRPVHPVRIPLTNPKDLKIHRDHFSLKSLSKLTLKPTHLTVLPFWHIVERRLNYRSEDAPA